MKTVKDNIKVIENRKTTLTGLNGEATMSYFDLVKLVITSPNPEGYGTEKMRQTLKICETIDINKDSSSVEIELNDFTALKESLNKFKWAQPHKDTLTFIDYINSLQIGATVMIEYLQSHPWISLLTGAGHLLFAEALSELQVPTIFMQLAQLGAWSITITVGIITIVGFINKNKSKK